MVATQQGKEHALAELAKRRANKPKLPDNSSLPAGSPMYFGCISCGAVIVLPENYLTPQRLCIECQALTELGWLA